MHAATITINAPPEAIEARLSDRAALERAFGEPAPEWRFSLLAAPGARGVEVHASAELDQKKMKAGLRKLRSLLEAGEVPTGAPAP